MIKVRQYVNELMTSNCFIVWNDETKHCMVIDPGSEKSLKEIEFIKTNLLILDYIILTHEHTDHTWGCNSIVSELGGSVICSDECKKRLPYEGKMYFLLYFDNEDYNYCVKRVDIEITDTVEVIKWGGNTIKFIKTPGHSIGSMCVLIEDKLFTGDTLMNYKLYVDKRSGSKEELEKNVKKLLRIFQGQDIMIYPGHGDIFKLKMYLKL